MLGRILTLRITIKFFNHASAFGKYCITNTNSTSDNFDKHCSRDNFDIQSAIFNFKKSFRILANGSLYSDSVTKKLWFILESNLTGVR